MRIPGRQSTGAWVDRRGDLLAVCMLAVCLVGACGDAAGTPIRSPKRDAASPLHDAGDDMPDATSSATVLDPMLPPIGMPGNDGPDSMHDGHPNDDIPRVPFCYVTANWPGDFRDDELQMQEAINDWRRGRPRCQGGPDLDPLPALSFPAELRCSARVHSFDMSRGGFSEKRGTDGSTPAERMAAAGYAPAANAETVFRSGRDATDTFYKLLDNPEPCANLSNPAFTAVGVGEYAGAWTLDFAAAEP